MHGSWIFSAPELLLLTAAAGRERGWERTSSRLFMSPKGNLASNTSQEQPIDMTARFANVRLGTRRYGGVSLACQGTISDIELSRSANDQIPCAISLDS